MKNRKLNPINISLARYNGQGLIEDKICDIKWDKRETPLMVSKELGHWHYHHYYENGKLVAHLKNNKTREKIKAEAGISKSVSELIDKLNLLG
ncbi:MAG: hypothetical protein Q8R37_01030 [Nanoarchaeota archaeon]|nr:hypothetical protein [Nanoarchaeota archaeon]